MSGFPQLLYINPFILPVGWYIKGGGGGILPYFTRETIFCVFLFAHPQTNPHLQMWTNSFVLRVDLFQKGAKAILTVISFESVSNPLKETKTIS